MAATIARTAIAAKNSRPKTRIGFALGAGFARSGTVSLSSAGPVPRRVAALLEQAPRRRMVLIGAGLVVLALTCVCVLEAANDLQDLLSLAHRYRRG